MMRPKYPPFGAGSIAIAADPITWEDITDSFSQEPQDQEFLEIMLRSTAIAFYLAILFLPLIP